MSENMAARIMVDITGNDEDGYSARAVEFTRANFKGLHGIAAVAWEPTPTHALTALGLKIEELQAWPGGRP